MTQKEKIEALENRVSKLEELVKTLSYKDDKKEIKKEKGKTVAEVLGPRGKTPPWLQAY